MSSAHEVNQHMIDPDHPWLLNLDIIMGKPCCNGTVIKMNHQQVTSDLSEQKEDETIRIAEDIIRAVFDAARRDKLLQNKRQK